MYIMHDCMLGTTYSIKYKYIISGEVICEVAEAKIQKSVTFYVYVWSTDKLFRKNRLFFQPPQKVMQQFFWGAQDLIFVQLILIMQKITKKSLLGHFLGYPPKMHYSALQCSAMYWSANAWIIHSRWVK